MGVNILCACLLYSRKPNDITEWSTLNLKGSERVLTAVSRSFIYFSSYFSFMQNQDRHQLRHNLLYIRRHLDAYVQELAAQKIAAKICDFEVFRYSKNIACYLAIKGELDVMPLIQQIWKQKKTCYLPLVDQQEKRRLSFVSYSEHDCLLENKYHILQPVYEETKILLPQQLDLVIVPLVGFDIGGNRLGQGGGYYDYTFSFKLDVSYLQTGLQCTAPIDSSSLDFQRGACEESKRSLLDINEHCERTRNKAENQKAKSIVQKSAKPYLLGVAYEWQKITDIPVSSWDVKLDAVVTDEAWYCF